MLFEVKTYLDEVQTHLHLDSSTESKVLQELNTYFQEKVRELELEGIPEQDAVKRAIQSCGEPKTIALLMYQAHSKGTWIEAILSSQPHLIAAVIFGTHLWQLPVFVVVALLFIVGTGLIGWRHGKPNWMYPWIGYALIPIVAGGYLSSSSVGRAAVFFLSGNGEPISFWIVMILLCFYGASCWIIWSTTLRVIRQDWIFASLMLLPVPVFLLWVSQIDIESFNAVDAHANWDAIMAYIFGLLGLTSVFFMRFRQRLYKVSSVAISGIFSGVIMARYVVGRTGVFPLLIISIFLFVFLVSPGILVACINRLSKKNHPWSDELLEKVTTVH